LYMYTCMHVYCDCDRAALDLRRCMVKVSGGSVYILYATSIRVHVYVLYTKCDRAAAMDLRRCMVKVSGTFAPYSYQIEVYIHVYLLVVYTNCDRAAVALRRCMVTAGNSLYFDIYAYMYMYASITAWQGQHQSAYAHMYICKYC
jgi:hypothetical protein